MKSVYVIYVSSITDTGKNIDDAIYFSLSEKKAAKTFETLSIKDLGPPKDLRFYGKFMVRYDLDHLEHYGASSDMRLYNYELF